jgi:hypothetical protein
LTTILSVVAICISLSSLAISLWAAKRKARETPLVRWELTRDDDTPGFWELRHTGVGTARDLAIEVMGGVLEEKAGPLSFPLSVEPGSDFRVVFAWGRPDHMVRIKWRNRKFGQTKRIDIIP